MGLSKRNFNSNPLYTRMLHNWRELIEKQTTPELAFEKKLCKLGVRYRFQDLRWKYIIDFTLPDYKIAIEIDGPSHNTAEARRKDRERDTWLESGGWQVFRFTNQQVLSDPEACVDAIRDSLPPVFGKA